MPVRIGSPGEQLSGLADSVESSRMTVAAGLVLHGAYEVALSNFAGVGGGRSPAVEKLLGPVKRWLQDFF
jgi:hypothetical protein